MRSIMSRHPILAYLGLTFVLSWGAVLAITGGRPVAAGQAAQVGVGVLLGPSVAGLVMTWVTSGRQGLRDLYARLLRWRVRAGYVAFAVLACPLITLAVVWAMGLHSPDVAAPLLVTQHPWTLVASAIVAGLVVSLLEEVGWTGFAVPRMLRGHGTVRVGVSLGVVWGLWHAVLFWQPETFSGGLPFLLFVSQLFANLLALRVIMVWLYQRTRSLGVIVVLHAAVVTSLILFEPVLEGTPFLAFIWLRGAAWALLALALVAWWWPAPSQEDRAPAPAPRPRRRGSGWGSASAALLLVAGTAGAFASTPPADASGSALPIVNETREASAMYSEIDKYLRGRRKALRIPNVVVAVVEGDRMVHAQGFGPVGDDGDAPTTETPFGIGSLTKSFTALAVMQLVEDGRVDLDQPVSHYLPWFRLASPGDAGLITVRHLLNQTSGLPQLPGMRNLAHFDDRSDALERMIRELAHVRPSHRPGTSFEYSNLNFDILGLVIETVSGESYASYLQRHVLEPLQMRHTHTSTRAAQEDGLAAGHRFWFGFPVAVGSPRTPVGSLPSGQLFSSAGDMAHYLSAHLNGGVHEGERVLSAAGITQLHDGVAKAVTMDIDLGRYAMGWFQEDLADTTVLSHDGIMPEYSAYMAMLPEMNRAFVLLINVNSINMAKTALVEMGETVTRLLARQRPAAPAYDWMPWIPRALLLIPVIQLGGVALTVHRLRFWRQQPPQRRPRTWLIHIGAPLLPALALTAVPVALWVSDLLPFARLYQPDITWLFLSTGGFAASWAVIRTWLAARAMRPPASATGNTP